MYYIYMTSLYILIYVYIYINIDIYIYIYIDIYICIYIYKTHLQYRYCLQQHFVLNFKEDYFS